MVLFLGRVTGELLKNATTTIIASSYNTLISNSLF
jgi:hypothetical protein